MTANQEYDWTPADIRKLTRTAQYKALPRHGKTREIVKYALARYDHGEGLIVSPKRIARDLKLSDAKTVRRAFARAVKTGLLEGPFWRVKQVGGNVVLCGLGKAQGRQTTNQYVVNPELGLSPTLRVDTSSTICLPQVSTPAVHPRGTATQYVKDSSRNRVVIERTHSMVGTGGLEKTPTTPDTAQNHLLGVESEYPTRPTYEIPSSRNEVHHAESDSYGLLGSPERYEAALASQKRREEKWRREASEREQKEGLCQS